MLMHGMIKHSAQKFKPKYFKKMGKYYPKQQFSTYKPKQQERFDFTSGQPVKRFYNKDFKNINYIKENQAMESQINKEKMAKAAYLDDLLKKESYKGREEKTEDISNEDIFKALERLWLSLKILKAMRNVFLVSIAFHIIKGILNNKIGAKKGITAIKILKALDSEDLQTLEKLLTRELARSNMYSFRPPHYQSDRKGGTLLQVIVSRYAKEDLSERSSLIINKVAKHFTNEEIKKELTMVTVTKKMSDLLLQPNHQPSPNLQPLLKQKMEPRKAQQTWAAWARSWSPW